LLLSQIVAAGANPVQITRGIEKTAKALVNELQKMSKEVISCYHCIMFWNLVMLGFLFTPE
jgi:chaperonin GroEL (HSP60 family)